MKRLTKNSAIKNKKTSPKNASPVCYLESDEVRPEYRIDDENKRNENPKPKSGK